jgi:integrase
MVFYYQCYDEKGRRQYAKSTGKTKKTEAVLYCMGLFKEGLLIPEQKAPTFGEYSKGWWETETCNYLKWRELHEPLAYSTTVMFKGHFEKHIKDYWAKYRFDEITVDAIEKWLLKVSEKSTEGKKTLKPKTINLILGTFKTMLGEAHRKKVIKSNPCAEVRELRVDAYERVIFTVDEVRKLFPVNWVTVWKCRFIYMLNRLAACTGMRLGELRGLRAEHIFDDYIDVCGQYTRYGYKPLTKTKDNRKIPIMPLIKQELDVLIGINGEGYLFSDDGGETPIPVERIGYQFDSALKKIGISHEERKKRNLTFHAWRHFLNTYLRMHNVSDAKVQSVTGHRTKKMTDRYTHFDTRQFTEVRDIQSELLALPDNSKQVETKIITGKTKVISSKKPEGKTIGKPKAEAVKKPVTKKKTAAKKKATA